MPDWSYQTLFRPLLFRLPAKIARNATLHAMGGLSRIPGGSLVIRTLGHMEVSPLLEGEAMGVTFKYPVGLSGGLDPQGTAHTALAQFGFGFIEVGPVTIDPIDEEAIIRDAAQESIIYKQIYANVGLEAIVKRLKGRRGHKLPMLMRLRHMPGRTPAEATAEMKEMLKQLSPYAAGFYLDISDASWSLEDERLYLSTVMESARLLAPGMPLLLYCPLDAGKERLAAWLDKLEEAGAVCDGIVVGDAWKTEQGYVIGRGGLQHAIQLTSWARQACGDALTIIAAGGVHEPEDGLALTEAGANYVQLHSGLVFSGPGLPKRINEALLHRIVEHEEVPQPPSFWQGWGWMCLLGISMIIGGIIAWVIAATTVVLPYDLAFLCATPEMLNQLNDRLLPFMSHDRITLAGTMISIGVLYYQLARYGLRQRLHWARTAIMTSALFGFSSFFLYLGYGYFDPLHAAVAAVLLPMFVLSMRDRKEEPYRKQPNMRNDRVWRMAQRGQFMMVSLGFALVLGGIIISYIGITDVFVPEDLAFLMTSPAVLEGANENLIPLIAHDRAGFGGALLSVALGLLATALWGIQEGQRWLWWTFLAAGLPPFIAAFSVHFWIGYVNWWHLTPPLIALLLFVLALIWLYPYLMRAAPAVPLRIHNRERAS
ncbi:Dihydroorotate dehydrogenase (quinone) [Paenibacillus plantiphilus]|uniref:Dihydroorotate dehydrogenase (Quinone) n=1 Tax=Paenibacillus plantiphilus TaxID=2905650 RepID=A0ABM9CKQ3_9BACL|nr:hypothetical protein [Paenibacillus plantiphilus]CAH1215232.1 Dihydroorotate dehydrogenase (quinone) [Paenibacillus plantiphilus]